MITTPANIGSSFGLPMINFENLLNLLGFAKAKEGEHRHGREVYSAIFRYLAIYKKALNLGFQLV
ncbi:hypothetical protein [Campylobacter curvus]|uniref:hypothetical protein n=1 Tax=Campylobacter curvus TaxID=200 RepID=UPI00147058DB|nr:hypothetical protein [Campylobacter curvus]